jgi:putative transposase
VFTIAWTGVHVAVDPCYRDLRHPPISLWEHRLALKRLREAGRSQVDEPAIFRTIENMRTIADEAVLARKAARRYRERRIRLTTLAHTSESEPSSAQGPTALEPSQTLQPHEQMLPVEEWA